MKIEMGFLILLLSGLLLLSYLSTAVLIIDQKSVNNSLKIADEDRLSNNIIPIYYVISLELHAMNRDAPSQGQCNIDIKVYSPTKNISFHADLSQIQKLFFVSIIPLNVSHTKYDPISFTYNSENNIVVIFFLKEIPPGSYSLTMTFLYTEDNESIFRTSFINDEGERTWLVALDFLPIGARRIFPCWDEPGFSAIFNIFITYDHKSHKNYTILSKPTLHAFDTKHLTNLKTNPLIPTYHISAILFSHFVTSDSWFAENPKQCNIKHRKKLLQYYSISFAHIFIDQMITYFKSRKCLDNTTDLTYILIPGFRHEAISNLELIYYREEAVIFNTEQEPPIRKTEISRLIGRSVAYQCFRNRINPSWWSYMWLIEGITTLLALDAIDKVHPNFRIKDLFVVQTLQESLRFDNNFVMKPLITEIKNSSEIESIFSISYYMKAPAILRMLQHILTNDVFQKGIDTYLGKDFSLDKVTTIDAFWSAIEREYETSENTANLRIKQLMDGWTKQKHYPVVKVKQNDSVVIILIENMDTDEKNWQIPFTTTTNANNKLNFSLFNLQKKMLLSSTGDQYSDFSIGRNWIIINIQQIGYYRVHYDETVLERIGLYLNSNKKSIQEIHVLNRAQIIDDAFYFLMRNELDLHVFLDLTRYLWQETDFIAWYPVFKGFENISPFFHFRNSSYFKENMLQTLDIFLDNIKHRAISYMIDSLQQEIFKWACIFDSSTCKQEANTKLEKHLKETSDLPFWKHWIYCNGLMEADKVTWDLMFNKYIKKPDYKILEFLACSNNFLIIRDYIELKTEYNETIKDYDRIHIFHSIVARHAKNDTMLDYLLKNLDKIKPREITVTVTLLDIINHVYSQEQLAKITNFVHNYLTWPNHLLVKHPFMDYKLYQKIKECTKYDLPDITILMKVSLLKRKIELRLHEITQQKERFQHLHYYLI